MKKAKQFLSKHGWLVVLAIIIPAGEILLLWPIIKNKLNKNKIADKKDEKSAGNEEFLKAG